MKSSAFVNLVIVLLTLMIVLLPVLIPQFRDEVARWHLAAAANAEQLGIGNKEASLEKAREWSRDILGVRDNWLLKLQSTLDKDPAKIPELLQQAKVKNPNFASLGLFAVSPLESEGEYELAVKVLEESLSEKQRERDFILNHLAYLRALGGIELDIARNDINQALKSAPENAALRDTRAWVLYGLGEFEDALEDADFAVKASETSRTSNPLAFITAWGEPSVQVNIDGNSDSEDPKQTSGDDSVESNDSSAETDIIPMSVYQEGVMRYHRGRILEALGRDEEMELDWQWLREHNLPIDDSLH